MRHLGQRIGLSSTSEQELSLGLLFSRFFLSIYFFSSNGTDEITTDKVL